MKRIILSLVLICASLAGLAQNDTTSIGSNPYVSAFKNIDWKEMRGQLSEFSYGFLNQGVKTVVGTYETIKQLPDALKQIDDLDYLDFATFTAKSVYEGVANTVTDYVSGGPEKSGAAAFDIVLLIDGGKQAVKTGAKGVKRAQDVFSEKTYHYTDKAAGKSIKKNGLQKPSSRGIPTEPEKDVTYTTDEAYLMRDEAIDVLALKQEYGTVDTRVTIIKDERWAPKEVRPVKPKFGKPGGGTEEIRNVDVPPSAIYDVSRIHPKPIMLAKDYVITPVVKSFGLFEPSAITSAISQEIIDNATEGGHNLAGTVGLVFVIEDSIMQGGFKQLKTNDIQYVFINPNDIDKLTPTFIECLSGNASSSIANQSTRSRENVISRDRTQRGL